MNLLGPQCFLRQRIWRHKGLVIPLDYRRKALLLPIWSYSWSRGQNTLCHGRLSPLMDQILVDPSNMWTKHRKDQQFKKKRNCYRVSQGWRKQNTQDVVCGEDKICFVVLSLVVYVYWGSYQTDGLRVLILVRGLPNFEPCMILFSLGKFLPF